MLSDKPKLPLHVVFHAKEGALDRIVLSLAPKFSYEIFAPDQFKLKIKRWLEGYLKGASKRAPLPVDLSLLPPFSQAVLKALCAVPFGQTATYQQIAKRSGNAKACRAVGNICHNNRYPLLIPCHRIIKSDGTLGGFALGSQLKGKLLAFEKTP